MFKWQKIFGKEKNITKKEMNDYLDNALNNHEKNAIEKKANHSVFNREALEGFEENNVDLLNDVPSFNDFKERISKKDTHLPKNSYRSLINKIAALLIILITIAAIYLYWNENKSERIFADNFEGYNNPKMYALRDANDGQISATLQKATTFYLEKDFSNAVLYFEAYLKNNQSDLQGQFYLGMSYLQNKNATKAIEYLSLVAGQESEFKEDATWHLALSYLKNKDVDSAKEVLTDISKINSTYSNKAKELLNQF